MKKFKLVSTVALIVAITIYALGILLTALDTTAEGYAVLTLIEANAVLFAGAVVGAFLMFSKSDAARKLGNGLTVVGLFTGACCGFGIITALTEAAGKEEPELPIGAILMIVAAVVLVLHYAFILVDYLLNRNASEMVPSEDKRIALIKEWKQLKEEGFITEEEFEDKRVQILGIKPKTK